MEELSKRELEKIKNRQLMEKYDKIRTFYHAIEIIHKGDYDDEILEEVAKVTLIQHDHNFMGFELDDQQLINNLANEMKLLNETFIDILRKLADKEPKVTPSKSSKVKYIRSFQLAKILGVSSSIVSQWCSGKIHLPNYVKTAKPIGLYIPYSDIDIFVVQYQPYKIAWNNYLNSNFDFSSELPESL